MRTYFIAPTHYGVGLTSVALGLFRALDRIGCRVKFFKPITQAGLRGKDPDYFKKMMETISGKTTEYEPLQINKVAELLASNKRGVVMESIIESFSLLSQDAEVVIVEGIVPTRSEPYARKLNGEIASTLSAQTILVSARQNNETLKEIADYLEIAGEIFGGLDNPNVLGYIVNHLSEEDYAQLVSDKKLKPLPKLAKRSVEPLGYIKECEELKKARVCDYVLKIDASVIYAGDMGERRVSKCLLCARTPAHMCDLLKPGVLVITPSDRDDIILATCMAAQNGVLLAGLLITGKLPISELVLELCMPAIKASGLPVIQTDDDSYETVVKLDRMDTSIPSDDTLRIEKAMNEVAEHIDSEWLRASISKTIEQRLSPPAFRYSLVQKARKNKKRIVLPEGAEPRTVQAAIYCQQHNIADCLLLGDVGDIELVAKNLDLTLPDDLKILNPKSVKNHYVKPMMELRKHKGLSQIMAEQMLEDNVVLGTMMLAEGDVDGLVAGALNTTANTIRPAFQLIKAKENLIISSIFFMLMPDQVLVYGDCAVNPDPTAEALASIAIQSAESARAFGIEPRIAMISYSTGDSGQGFDVDKVREATRLVKESRPDLIIDGPLQYDAASVASVAKSKAPKSPVAGRATVFIFPDLNTGNTTYKAVQRSANVISVGPMLQGLRKPVNDLSRGASLDDIIYTIALTVVQAQQE